MATKLDDSRGSLWSRQLWLYGLWACIYMQPSVGWSACDERQAKQQDNHNSQWSGPSDRITSDTSDRLNIKGAHQHCIDPLTTDTDLSIECRYRSSCDRLTQCGWIYQDWTRTLWQNVNLDGQQASTRTWMWHWWFQPRKASSQCMIPNWSTHESYVSNSIEILISQMSSQDYELSPVQASLFDESGAMRAQSKAVLKTKLQVE